MANGFIYAIFFSSPFIAVAVILWYLKIIIINFYFHSHLYKTKYTVLKKNGVMEFEVWPYPLLVTRYCD